MNSRFDNKSLQVTILTLKICNFLAHAQELIKQSHKTTQGRA